MNLYQNIKQKLGFQDSSEKGHVLDTRLSNRQVSNLNRTNQSARDSMNFSYEKYCSYCSSKIFDTDRTCPRCGAPTMNSIIIEEPRIREVEIEVNNRKNVENGIKDLENYYPYSDIRVSDYGDSFSFDLNQRDIFSNLRKGKSFNKTTEIHKLFNGQICLIPDLEYFTDEDVSVLFMSTIGNLSNNNVGLNVSGFNQNEFVRLSQIIQAWNGGQSVLAVGNDASLTNVLPYDSNYRYNIGGGEKIKFIKNFLGIDVLTLPQIVRTDSPFSFRFPTDRIWLVSPTGGKLLKIVSENEKFGVGIGISSIVGTMVI